MSIIFFGQNEFHLIFFEAMRGYGVRRIGLKTRGLYTGIVYIRAIMILWHQCWIRHLIRQSKMTDKSALFPAFWGPTVDDIPDQDHGNMTSLCLIFMLLQTNGNTYTAFPLWPKKWNVHFRLPLSCDTYIVGEQVNGRKTVHEERVSNEK